ELSQTARERGDARGAARASRRGPAARRARAGPRRPRHHLRPLPRLLPVGERGVARAQPHPRRVQQLGELRRAPRPQPGRAARAPGRGVARRGHRAPGEQRAEAGGVLLHLHGLHAGGARGRAAAGPAARPHRRHRHARGAAGGGGAAAAERHWGDFHLRGRTGPQGQRADGGRAGAGRARPPGPRLLHAPRQRLPSHPRRVRGARGPYAGAGRARRGAGGGRGAAGGGDRDGARRRVHGADAAARSARHLQQDVAGLGAGADAALGLGGVPAGARRGGRRQHRRAPAGLLPRAGRDAGAAAAGGLEDVPALALHPLVRVVALQRFRAGAVPDAAGAHRGHRAAPPLEALPGRQRRHPGRRPGRGVRAPHLHPRGPGARRAHGGQPGRRPARAPGGAGVDDGLHPRGGAGQAGRVPQQDRLPRSLAGLLGAGDPPRLAPGQRAARAALVVRALPCAHRPQGGPRRVADDGPLGERVLQRVAQRDRLPRRHPAAPVLRPAGGRRGQLRGDGRGDRPRDGARLRRPGAPLRRLRQPARLVDGRRRRRVPRAGPARGRPVLAVPGDRHAARQRPAHRGREHRGPGRPHHCLPRAAEGARRQAAGAGGRAHAGAALLHGVGADLAPQHPPRDAAAAGDHRSARALAVAHQRPPLQHARVRARLRVPSRGSHGAPRQRAGAHLV
ncbi:MAG: Metallopeptidase, partial [uncultured Gemmatimonadetes bacterium]